MIILSLVTLLILLIAGLSFYFSRKVPPLVEEINQILIRLSNTAVGAIPISKENLLNTSESELNSITQVIKSPKVSISRNKKVNSQSKGKLIFLLFVIAVVAGIYGFFVFEEKMQANAAQIEGKAYGALATKGLDCLKTGFKAPNESCGDNVSCQQTHTINFINSCLDSVFQAKRSMKELCDLSNRSYAEYCAQKSQFDACTIIDLLALKEKYCN